ncbi:MAG: hypothetical protein LQ339_008458 [Xanthoria mediterranea]|nr:MAG: hypothetical protein LQ339_008458 [Xanthoria mediterranea]
MSPQIRLAEKADVLEKQRKDNAKKRKQEAKRNKKLKNRQVRVEVVIKEHEQLLIHRRTRHLLWSSFLDTTIQTGHGSLKWLTLENMHDAIRDMWPNTAFRETVRQIHDLPKQTSPDRFMEIATLVSPRLLLQIQSSKAHGSPYAYHIAEIFLRLKYTLPASTPNTALGQLKGGQAILEDTLLLELKLKESESSQDVYLRVRDSFCRQEAALATFAQGVQYDEILQLFQGLARIHCPHLEDVQDPLGAAHYLGFSKIRITSLEGSQQNHHEDEDINTGATGAQDSTITAQKDSSHVSSSDSSGTTVIWLLAGIVAFDTYQIIGSYFTYSFPPRFQPANADSKDIETDKAIYAEAHRLPWAHYDPLRRLIRLFRRQVSRAEPGAFKEAIDKLEDKAIAWVIELDKIEEVRKRWFKEEA